MIKLKAIAPSSPNFVVGYGIIKKIKPIYNLERFTYLGACNEDARFVADRISRGDFGSPLVDRLLFTNACKDYLNSLLIGGGSIRSVISHISCLKLFVAFLEGHGLPFDMNALEANYFAYCEYIYQRSCRKNATLSKSSAYQAASRLSKILGDILETPRNAKLIRRTRLPYPNQKKSAIGRKAEKQNLEDTFKFGSFVIRVIRALTIEAVAKSASIKIEINGIPLGGARKHLPQWVYLNLRVISEFILFIAQTGMNLAQAKDVSREQFKFRPLGEG